MYDGGSTACKSLEKFCSNVYTPKQLHSSSNQMYIKYIKNGLFDSQGFSLYYSLGMSQKFYSVNIIEKNLFACFR